MTWANFAWGFSNGGEDHSNGMQAVLVDLDEHESIIPDLSANGFISPSVKKKQKSVKDF